MEATKAFDPFSPADLRGEARKVETCLPGHLLVLMIEDCIRKHWRFRHDIHEHLNRASVAALEGMDSISVQRCAKLTDDLARRLLHGLSPDDPRDGLFVCAMFAIVLQDEGFWTDPTSPVITCSLLILEDGKEEGAAWALREPEVQSKARSMLRRATLLGYFLKRPPPLPRQAMASARGRLR